ncbi:MAG TPA: DegT/DnrJ/EryC1/StrS aminotransferase family protein [Chthoniobacterales bacterium]|jgi:perosamine synthetase|nr:DegT/DnrJ/EryC1/StrS aminotransferase family protein [Chthoniobacterales bacterium]
MNESFPRIPIYRPNLTGNEKRYVDDCLASSWISSKGAYIEKFETAFSQFTSNRHCISVCNGTVALHVALLALGIGPGDEVIVPTFTYIASANAITYTGARPVFVDSLRDTWQMDPNDVREKITPRTKAILCVHLYGHPCDLQSLRKIADSENIFLVEDCAEALGSKFNDIHVGNVGDIATYSFYGNKTVTTGEGGMVATNDAALASRAIHLKGQGLANNREYWHDVIGYNYRMTNICAAIGLAQLERVDAILKQKRQVAKAYQFFLEATGFEVHSEAKNVRHSYWMVSVLVPESARRDSIRSYLSGAGIETRPAFYPIHKMPMYAQHNELHRVAEDISERGINLPSFPDLESSDIERIANALKQAV